MKRESVRYGTAVGMIAGLLAILATAIPLAAQQRQPIVSSQQVALAEGERFATLPGFVERMTPEGGPVYLVTPPLNNPDNPQPPIAPSNLIIIAFDAQGRPWVSPSAAARGSPPQLLVDANGDGIYEAMKPISEQMNTCHGLWWESLTTLYCVGFGPKVEGDHWTNERGLIIYPHWQIGLYRAIDANGDDVADRFERVVPLQAEMNDHGPHRVFRAADGSIQMILGNNGPPTETTTNLDSILRQYPERDFLPRLTDRWGKTSMQSSVVRVDTLARRSEVIFAGYRNAVGFTWNLLGETFFFDSDMEPELGSPWYREIRSYHGIPNADYGFRNGSNKWPSDYFDILPPIRELDRGSPTGVTAYHAWAYPAEWRDVIFEADYSGHRILYGKATLDGASYTMRTDSATFVSGTSVPVTDLEVGPDGMLYFTLNGTGGGLYRVRYTGPAPEQPDMSGIYAVTRQAQPLSSWGYEAIERVKASMGANAFRSALERVARNRDEASEDRFRALQEMNRHGVPAPVNVLRSLSNDPDVQVRATVALLAGLQTTNAAKSLAASMLRDGDALVRRRAIEAVLAQGLTPATASRDLVNEFYRLLSDSDRFVRFAARAALERTPRGAWRERVLAETNPVVAFPGLLTLNNTAVTEADRAEIYEEVIEWLRRTDLAPEHRLSALRMFEIAAWDRPGGAPGRVRGSVRDLLLAQYPSEDPRLNLEMTKVLAYTGSNAGMDPNMPHGTTDGIYLLSPATVAANTRVIEGALSSMPRGDETMTEQMDYMYALRFIKSGWTEPWKEQVIAWYGGSMDWRPGGNSTTAYLRSMWADWSSVLTPAERTAALERYPTLVPAVNAAGFGGGGGPAGGAPGGGIPGGGVTPPQ